MNEEEPERPTLEYAPAPRRRGWRRPVTWGLVVGFSVLLTASGIRYGEAGLNGWRAWQHRRWAMAMWEQSLKYKPAVPGEVVYDEVEEMPAPLQRRVPAGYAPILKGFGWPMRGSGSSDVLLYAGERSNPKLTERMLLMVWLKSPRQGIRQAKNVWLFGATETLPAADGTLGGREWNQLEVLVPAELNDLGSRVRFYEGVADPADPRRVLVGYAVNGVRGQLEFKLNALSQVEIRVLDGPAIEAPWGPP